MKMTNVGLFSFNHFRDCLQRFLRPDCLHSSINCGANPVIFKLIVVAKIINNTVPMGLEQPGFRLDDGVLASALLVSVVCHKNLQLRLTATPNRESLFFSFITTDKSGFTE